MYAVTAIGWLGAQRVMHRHLQWLQAMGGRTVHVVIFAAYAALTVAWAMPNAPFAAPDEANHYVWAVGISDGSLLGQRSRSTNPALDTKLQLWAIGRLLGGRPGGLCAGRLRLRDSASHLVGRLHVNRPHQSSRDP